MDLIKEYIRKYGSKKSIWNHTSRMSIHMSRDDNNISTRPLGKLVVTTVTRPIVNADIELYFPEGINYLQIEELKRSLEERSLINFIVPVPRIDGSNEKGTKRLEFIYATILSIDMNSRYSITISITARTVQYISIRNKGE